MEQKDNKPILLIIPDIHGRLFWISATRKYPDLPVIFLGDYLDPYTYYEDILPSEALANFRDILSYKKDNMERVTLLLGNHDIHYFDRELNSSRKDRMNYDDIHQLYMKNLPQFKLAMTLCTGGKSFLFTHAGVDPRWLKLRMPEVDANDMNSICTALNCKLESEKVFLDLVKNALMDVSASRWGYARYPSPVWTDETDHQYMRERLPNVYQVFGHTQQESEPVITEQYAYLDCRRAFLLTSMGNIIKTCIYRSVLTRKIH